VHQVLIFIFECDFCDQCCVLEASVGLLRLLCWAVVCTYFAALTQQHGLFLVLFWSGFGTGTGIFVEESFCGR
jgi:hypothetical protein